MWKNLTKEDLDKAYNNSLAVSNSATIVQSWTESSALAKVQLNGECDIPYGKSKFQLFDYFPAKDNSPVIVFVHGGFWQMRSKNDFTFIVPALVDAGFSIAMLGYTLAPHAKMDEIIVDVSNGLKAISNYLMKRNSKSSNFWLLGWSAGAHLISMVLEEESVMGGTAISGIYDLEPMRHCYINDKLNLDEKTSLENSPIKLDQVTSKALDIFVGGAELPEMQRQSIDFATYRKSLGAVEIFQSLPGKNHYTIMDELTSKKGVIMKTLINRLIIDSSIPILI